MHLSIQNQHTHVYTEASGGDGTRQARKICKEVHCKSIFLGKGGVGICQSKVPFLVLFDFHVERTT